MVQIDSSDTYEDVIWKAAHVVPSERQLVWQQLELTAFIHFGMNTFTDQEWGDGNENPNLFNPGSLDVDQWVRTLKNGGFRQIILTAKHHDGFCLWPTLTTNHAIQYSKWQGGKGDIVKEVSLACKKHQIGFGVYLSPWDRNASSFGTEEYNELFKLQLSELLTNYGEIAEVWFDGANGEGPNGRKQNYDFQRWYQYIRNVQPKATIAIMGPDIRWVGTETGVGRASEWSVIPLKDSIINRCWNGVTDQSIFLPIGDRTEEDLGSRTQLEDATKLIWYPAETDVSIRPGWFYHQQEDEKVKTGPALFEIYKSSVGRNGVLLLNVPPTREGRIHPNDSMSIVEFGAIIRNTFKFNRISSIRYDQIDVSTILTDDSLETSLTLQKKDTITFEIITAEDDSVNLLKVQENIKLGQRVEKFMLEKMENNGLWSPVCEGTTIGYKRILSFPTQHGRRWRFTILSSRYHPAIAEIGLYKQY